jgi:hypothetical protein
MGLNAIGALVPDPAYLELILSMRKAASAWVSC